MGVVVMSAGTRSVVISRARNQRPAAAKVLAGMKAALGISERPSLRFDVGPNND